MSSASHQAAASSSRADMVDAESRSIGGYLTKYGKPASYPIRALVCVFFCSSPLCSSLSLFLSILLRLFLCLFFCLVANVMWC